MSLAQRLLRRSLVTSPSNNLQSFVLPCTKLVFEYCEVWGSNVGMRDYLVNDVGRLAKQYPSVEFVVRNRPYKHPVLRGYYTNERDKVICVRNLDASEVAGKVKLLLDSSGSKIKPLKRAPVDSINPSVRGIWSPFHEPTVKSA